MFKFRLTGEIVRGDRSCGFDITTLVEVVTEPYEAVTAVADVVARAFRNARLSRGVEVVTVAMDVLAVLQSTALVISLVVPLLKVPVAVILVRLPTTSAGVDGVMAIEVKLPPVTLRVEVPGTPL
jgi:hypothetical protein